MMWYVCRDAGVLVKSPSLQHQHQGCIVSERGAVRGASQLVVNVLLVWSREGQSQGGQGKMPSTPWQVKPLSE